LFESRYGFRYGPEGSRRGECHGRHGGRPSWRDLLRQVRGYSPFLTKAPTHGVSLRLISAFRQFLCDGVTFEGEHGHLDHAGLGNTLFPIETTRCFV